MENQFNPYNQQPYMSQFEPQVPQQFEPQVPQQFEPQVPQQFEPQVPQQFEPQVPQQQYEPQVPQQFEPQVPQQQYEPQVPQQFEPQISQQQYEPQVQTFEPQIPQQIEPQVQPFEPTAQPLEPQVQPFDPQAQPLEPQEKETFEPQIKQVETVKLTNVSQDETPNEDNYENESNNLVVPMINQDKDSLADNYLSGKQRTYGLFKIFIIFLVQTAVYIVFCKVPIMTKTTGLPVPIVILLLLGLFLSVAIKCYDGKYDNFSCSIFLYVFFFIYKTYFFIFIYFIVKKIDVKNVYCIKSDSTKDTSSNKTNLGNFDFAHIAVGSYYLAFCLYIYFLQNINLMLFAIVAGGVTIVMFCSLLAINAAFAAFTAMLIVIELGVLLLILKISISKEKLSEDNFLNNIIVIDYYKYLIIMVISTLIIKLIILLLILCCLIISACCKTEYNPKTRFVDIFGNEYDKNHKRIEPDCIVF